jgi:hypothetical protein
MPHTTPSIVSRVRVTLRFNATHASRMISVSISSAGVPPATEQLGIRALGFGL